MKNRRYPILLLLLLLLLSGCDSDAHDEGSEDGHGHAAAGEGGGHDDHDDGDDGHDDHDQGEHRDHADGEVVLNPKQLDAAGIVVVPVAVEAAAGRLRLPAVVALPDDAEARVGAILPGRVARLHASEGDYVRRGAPLADIESPEVAKVRTEYLDAVAAERRARLELDRQEALAGEDVGVAREFEHAGAAFSMAEASRKEAAAHLRTYGIDPEKAGTNFSNRIRISAPISGIVADRGVTLGEYVDASDDIFRLVNTSRVWIDAKATPEQATSLTVGTPGFVVTPTGERRAGRVSFISPLVDPTSRRLTVRLVVDNTDGSLRPGTFATVGYETAGTTGAFLVDTDLVEEEEGDRYLWRRVADGTFERVVVGLGEEVGDRVIVTEGLLPGDELVIDGTFYLRSAMKAGSLSEHGHAH